LIRRSFKLSNYLFSAYGVSVEHPSSWQIFISPRNNFTKDDGFVKIEEANTETDSEASLGLRWEKGETTSEKFVDSYLDEIESQYKKKLKKENKYQIISKELIEINGHKGCVVKSNYIGNSGLFNFNGKNIKLKVVQVAFFCENTSRVLVGSITATAEKMDKEYDRLLSILLSIKCH
jgi:hypothetical protein